MRLKRIIRLILLIAAAILAVWFSFYTEPLKEHQEKALLKQFSPNQLVDYHWENDLDALLTGALSVTDFQEGMCQDAAAFSAKYAKVPGIGARSYFILYGEATLTEVCDQSVNFDLCPETTGKIQTRFLFSNTARDASGWFNANDFQNTMDYNTLSTYLNNRILNEVAKPVAGTLKVGDKLTWWGAIEIAPEDFPVKTLDIVPLRLQPKSK
jgi:predicted lipoprotein